jgi:hypothetical protein
MSSPPDDAYVGQIPQEWIAGVAPWYDRFAHALDPLSDAAAEAEEAFEQEIASMYDSLSPPKPSLHEFRKGVILRCKRFIIANDRR